MTMRLLLSKGVFRLGSALGYPKFRLENSGLWVPVFPHARHQPVGVERAPSLG